jgi:hypothetical protein
MKLISSLIANECDKLTNKLSKSSRLLTLKEKACKLKSLKKVKIVE